VIALKVSVLLPIYNGQRFLKRAIDSILNQTFKDFELIIINDGSTDKTRDILLQYEGSPNIQVFHKQNEGVTKTLNMAFSLSQGEYITFLSHDDWWLPYKLEREVKVMDACSKKIGVVYSNFYKYYEASKTAKPIFASPTAKEHIRNKCGLNISSSIIRRSALLHLQKRDGYVLDQTMKDCIDWDLWIRLAQICYFKHIPQLLTYYSIHKKQMSNTIQHSIVRWKLHLKWNGFKPKYFFTYVIRASLRTMLGRR